MSNVLQQFRNVSVQAIYDLEEQDFFDTEEYAPFEKFVKQDDTEQEPETATATVSVTTENEAENLVHAAFDAFEEEAVEEASRLMETTFDQHLQANEYCDWATGAQADAANGVIVRQWRQAGDWPEVRGAAYEAEFETLYKSYPDQGAWEWEAYKRYVPNRDISLAAFVALLREREAELFIIADRAIAHKRESYWLCEVSAKQQRQLWRRTVRAATPQVGNEPNADDVRASQYPF